MAINWLPKSTMAKQPYSQIGKDTRPGANAPPQWKTFDYNGKNMQMNMARMTPEQQQYWNSGAYKNGPRVGSTAEAVRNKQYAAAGNQLRQLEANRNTQGTPSQQQAGTLSSALAGNAPITARTGIQPQTPFTQQDISSADSQMRNMQTQLPQGMQHAGLADLLRSSTGALGNLAANQFSPQSNAALSQYDLGSQKAQADALQGWSNLGQNQLGRDLRFNQQQQNWLYNLMGSAANAPEYRF